MRKLTLALVLLIAAAGACSRSATEPNGAAAPLLNTGSQPDTTTAPTSVQNDSTCTCRGGLIGGGGGRTCTCDPI